MPVSRRSLIAFFAILFMLGVTAPLAFRDGHFFGSAPAEESPPVIITVSSGDALDADIVEATRALRGVLASGGRASGLIDLDGVEGATRPLVTPNDAVVPFSYAVVDPAVAAAVPGLEEATEALAAGEAVLTSTSAQLRGLGPGGSIQLAGPGGPVSLRVGAVVPDQSLARDEVILPADSAAALGVSVDESIVLVMEPSEAATAEASLRAVVGDRPVRVRATSAGSTVRGVGRLLRLIDVKLAFGEFWYRPHGGGRITIDPVWVDANIVELRLPLLGLLRCNTQIIPQLQSAMEEIVDAGLGHLVKTSDGCYNPRMQVGDSTVLSRHAIGIAVDINAGSNAFGAQPQQDPRLVEIMAKWGFAWGGNWTVPDGMHFEFVRFPNN